MASRRCSKGWPGSRSRRHREGRGRACGPRVGALMVNDVTALRADVELAGVVASRTPTSALCTCRRARTIRAIRANDDVVAEVAASWRSGSASRSIRHRGAADLPRPWVGSARPSSTTSPASPPGRDRGARPAVLVGISRKSTLRQAAGDPKAKTGTTAASVSARCLTTTRRLDPRVHDVPEHVEALRWPLRYEPDRALRARAARLPRRAREERATGSASSTTSGSTWEERGANDRIEEAVDYRDVVACVQAVNDVPRLLLEALAAAVADGHSPSASPSSGCGSGAQAGRPRSPSSTAPSPSSGP